MNEHQALHATREPLVFTAGQTSRSYSAETIDQEIAINRSPRSENGPKFCRHLQINKGQRSNGEHSRMPGKAGFLAYLSRTEMCEYSSVGLQAEARKGMVSIWRKAAMKKLPFPGAPEPETNNGITRGLNPSIWNKGYNQCKKLKTILLDCKPVDLARTRQECRQLSGAIIATEHESEMANRRQGITGVHIPSPIGCVLSIKRPLGTLRAGITDHIY